MSKEKRPLPTMQDVIDFLQKSNGKVDKRQISKAFGIKGDDRIKLKEILRNIKEAGTFPNKSARSFFGGLLRSKLNAEITGFDSNGALVARPLEYNNDQSIPQILIPEIPSHISPALKSGDVVVLKIKKAPNNTYIGEVIKRLSISANRIVGLYQTRGLGLGGIVTSVDRRIRDKFYVNRQDCLDTPTDSIVLADVVSFRKDNKAKIIKILGQSDTPFAATLISAYQHSIPLVFNETTIKEAENAPKPTMTARDDLRTLPFVTIDGDDAKDFDDTVFAEPDHDPNNKNGWHIIVAISDIAWFVRPNTALDHSAKERGNSVYFPDRAIHMLPEILPEKCASLMPNEDRPCLACHLWIDEFGHTIKSKFTRVMIRSNARLTYNDVEAVITNQTIPKNISTPIVNALHNLIGAFNSLKRYRNERGCLNIEGKEKQITLNKQGNITSIQERIDLQSYQLIEEFMIAANVAAAETLESLNLPAIYRIHDKPSEEKLSLLNDFLNSLSLNIKLPANPTPKDFNHILDIARNTKHYDSINEMVLRTQSPARYSQENIGHFGLSLKSYVHFTSPIRRYADLLIHRALIDGLKLGEGGFSGYTNMEEIADHITFTEKQADEAERDAESRYIALSIKDKIGETFAAKVSGVSHAGLFITLNDSKGEGFCPMRNLHDEYFLFDSEKNILIGQNSGKTYRIGDEITITLEDVNPITASIIVSICTNTHKPKQSHFWNRFKSKGHKHQ